MYHTHHCRVFISVPTFAVAIFVRVAVVMVTMTMRMTMMMARFLLDILEPEFRHRIAHHASKFGYPTEYATEIVLDV